MFTQVWYSVHGIYICLEILPKSEGMSTAGARRPCRKPAAQMTAAPFHFVLITSICLWLLLGRFGDG